jgi:hypothetical protein
MQVSLWVVWVRMFLSQKIVLFLFYIVQVVVRLDEGLKGNFVDGPYSLVDIYTKMFKQTCLACVRTGQIQCPKQKFCQ